MLCLKVWLSVQKAVSLEDQALFRASVIDQVLATDMKRHFSILSHFQNVFQRSQGSDQGRRISATGNNSPSNPNSILWDNLSREDKSLALQVQSTSLLPSSPWCIYSRALEASDCACKFLQVALKTADIGHLATEPKLHKRWALALEEEFFQQVGRQASSCLR